MILIGLLVGLLRWSGLTTFNPRPNIDLLRAGPAIEPGSDGATADSIQQTVLDCLNINSDPESCLFATVDSHGASALILATGHPVVTFGGTVGNDHVIDTAGLESLVADGTVRFVVANNNISKPRRSPPGWRPTARWWKCRACCHPRIQTTTVPAASITKRFATVTADQTD